MADEIIAYSLAKHPAPHRKRVGLAMPLYGLFAEDRVGRRPDDRLRPCRHACFPGETPLGHPQARFSFVPTVVLVCHLAAPALIASGTVVSYLMWRVTGPPQGHH